MAIFTSLEGSPLASRLRAMLKVSYMPIGPAAPCGYTREAIRYWVQNWSLLCALVETPGSAQHALLREHHHNGACRAPEGCKWSVAYAWAEVRADLCLAVNRLPIPERRVVAMVMQDYSLDEIAHEHQCPLARDVFHRAISLMVQALACPKVQ